MKNKICSLVLSGILMLSAVDISMRFVQPELKKQEQVIAGHASAMIRAWAERLSQVDWSKWRTWGRHPRDRSGN